jgi:acyl-coenzyme A synthetase/AMP-(fatty) acid ligase
MRTVNAKYIVAHPDTLERAIQAAKNIDIPSEHIFVLGKNDINGISCVENQFWGHHEELAIPVKYTKEELAATTCYYYFTSGTTSHRKAVILT